MTGALLFIFGLIVGITISVFLCKKRIGVIREENEIEKNRPLSNDEDQGLGVDMIESDGKGEVVKLDQGEYELTGYVENEVAIISFQLHELFPELLRKNYALDKSQSQITDKMKKDFNEGKMIKILLDNNMMGYDLAKILAHGRARVYSKIDAKMVDEIIYSAKNHYKGPLSAHGEIRFYLPNGKLFFKIGTWVS